MNSEIKRFIKKSLFFLPLIIFASCLTATWYLSGENLSIEEVYNIQKENPNKLYGPAYSNLNIEYKFYNILNNDFDTIIIGTSRVMQFDVDDFPNATYNAGGLIAKIGHFPELLKYMLKENIRPKTIVIGLDQYFFNETWDSAENSEQGYVNRLMNSNKSINVNLSSIAPDFIKGKINIGKVVDNSFSKTNNIGLNSINNKNGFYASGQYFYGGKYIYNIEHDANFEDTYVRINDGDNRFEYGEDINIKAIEKLEELLKICKENNIEVIGIIPPYAPSVYNRLKEMGKYGYMDKLYDTIYPCFDQHNFKLYDFTFMPNTSDEQYVDGFHGGDYVYHLISQEILR